MPRAVGLAYPVRFAGPHKNQTEIGSQRGVVGVDGVEGKIVGCRKLEHFCARGYQLANQRGVLRLRGFDVGGMMESEVAPRGQALRLIPARSAGRAHQHAPERPDHGMAVAPGFGSDCGYGDSIHSDSLAEKRPPGLKPRS